MRIFLRYCFAFVGGFLAMSAHIYLLYGRGGWFLPQRLSATIGNALIFAHILAFIVIIVRDNPLKQPLVKFLLGLIIGTVLGAIAWFAHVFLYLYQMTPDLITLLLGGFGLSIGFVIAGILKISNRWLSFTVSALITIIAIYTPILLSHQAYIADSTAQALLYFQADNPNDIFLIGLPFAITISVFSHLPLLFSSSPHAEI
ncbi:MAG: hypothetical protein Phog2KO_04900 [Phototrophicaceae bacterium]